MSVPEHISGVGPGSPTPPLRILARRLVSLLDLALSEMVRGLERDERIKCPHWRAAVAELADQLGITVTRVELRWLWDSLRHEPRLSSRANVLVDDHLQWPSGDVEAFPRRACV